jgi:hypothetical protein
VSRQESCLFAESQELLIYIKSPRAGVLTILFGSVGNDKPNGHYLFPSFVRLTSRKSAPRQHGNRGRRDLVCGTQRRSDDVNSANLRRLARTGSITRQRWQILRQTFV